MLTIGVAPIGLLYWAVPSHASEHAVDKAGSGQVRLLRLGDHNTLVLLVGFAIPRGAVATVGRSAKAKAHTAGPAPAVTGVSRTLLVFPPTVLPEAQ